MAGCPAVPGGQLGDLRARARAACREAEAAWLRIQATWQQVNTAWQCAEAARCRAEGIAGPGQALSGRGELLRRSVYARMRARLASMPVIEQAKGIITARTGWPPDQAFDALRWASQLRNTPVRDLAAGIVAGAVQVPGLPRSYSDEQNAAGCRG